MRMTIWMENFQQDVRQYLGKFWVARKNPREYSAVRTDNPVQRTICDPGTKKFEGQNIGLFYTILSRATSLGDCDPSTPVKGSKTQQSIPLGLT